MCVVVKMKKKIIEICLIVTNEPFNTYVNLTVKDCHKPLHTHTHDTSLNIIDQSIYFLSLFFVECVCSSVYACMLWLDVVTYH